MDKREVLKRMGCLNRYADRVRSPLFKGSDFFDPDDIYRNGSYLTYVGADVTSYSNTGLSANTTYCYYVRAYNSCGFSDSSNEDCATTQSGGGGGCPFLYTWNGQQCVEDNNILPASEDTSRAELDVTDYFKLEQPLVPLDSNYVLQIKEFEREHTWLDSVALLTVDHSPQLEAGLTPNGEIVLYKKEASPTSCVDSAALHRSCLESSLWPRTILTPFIPRPASTSPFL